jgi:hypothetical protein
MISSFVAMGPPSGEPILAPAYRRAHPSAFGQAQMWAGTFRSGDKAAASLLAMRFSAIRLFDFAPPSCTLYAMMNVQPAPDALNEHLEVNQQRRCSLFVATGRYQEFF